MAEHREEHKDKEKKQTWFKARYLVLLLALCATIYVGYIIYSQSMLIAKYSGPILDDNWWEALNWIKNNTAECAVVATYWDPGHFITAIAERPVIYDGGTQNAVALFTTDGKSTERSRMMDVATALYTSNETKAIELLSWYKGNCSEMYFLATSDLVGKSQWWSYFSTWDPNKATGTKSNYYPLKLSQTRPSDDGSTNYVYSMGMNQAIIINERTVNNQTTLTPMYKEGTNFVKIKSMIAFSSQGLGSLQTYPDAELDALVWISPGGQNLIFIPPDLAKSMFTKMFFFNGQGLTNFEFVKDWGGEVKLFKIKFND